MGKKLGDPANPLLLSVRSGAKFSMPGMMNTILNLGLNDETVEGLAAKSGNPRFAYDCYRRFIQMFGEVALDIDMEKFDTVFDARKQKVKAQARHRTDRRRSEGDHRRLQEAGPEEDRQAASRRTPANSSRWRATPCSAPGGTPKAIYYRKMEKIPDDIGTAVQRAGHGVRQHGRHLRHRRRLHARPRPPAKRFSTASS